MQNNPNNGRVDIRVEVNTLDIKETDVVSLKAKEIIENKVFKKLASYKVLVVVVNRYSREFSSKVVGTNEVRKFAETVVNGYIKGHPAALKDDFIIVEHHIDNETVNVTKL